MFNVVDLLIWVKEHIPGRTSLGLGTEIFECLLSLRLLKDSLFLG